MYICDQNYNLELPLFFSNLKVMTNIYFMCNLIVCLPLKPKALDVEAFEIYSRDPGR